MTEFILYKLYRKSQIKILQKITQEKFCKNVSNKYHIPSDKGPTRAEWEA